VTQGGAAQIGTATGGTEIIASGVSVLVTFRHGVETVQNDPEGESQSQSAD